MKPINMALCAAIVLSLSGCAAYKAKRQEQRTLFNATRPTCANAEQCQPMWEMAQLWVSEHAQSDIKTANNVLIETYSGPRTTDLVYRISKVPLGGGKYRIQFEGYCTLELGIGVCTPDTYTTGILFNQAINKLR